MSKKTETLVYGLSHIRGWDFAWVMTRLSCEEFTSEGDLCKNMALKLPDYTIGIVRN
jgi:hypothetical protein